MSVPTRDSKLVPWTTTFNAVLVADGTSVYHLSASDVSSYTALHTPYLAAAAAAADPAQRNKSLVAARNSLKGSLVHYARQLYLRIQADATISDQAKIDAGIVVRKTVPTPIPPPADAPEIDVLSVSGRTARLRLHGAESTRRARPAGTSGAAVFSFVGESAPADISGWKWEGNTSLTRTNVTFPSTVANGATVWFTAVWFNNRKQTGPMAQPKNANLPGGSVQAA